MRAPQPIYKILAKRVRDERKKAGLSIEELAEAAGIGSSFLAYIETEGRKPSLATVAKLANALRIPLADLFRNVPVERGGEEYKFLRQCASLVRDKTPSQRTVIMKTLRTLSKGL